MISISELNPKGVVLTPSMHANIKVLHERINKVRAAYAKPMAVTSGVRSQADHKRIYADIAKRNGSSVIRVPMGSKHLTAQAVDIADKDGSLMSWCKANVSLLEESNLWIEAETKGWVHFQTVAEHNHDIFRTLVRPTWLRGFGLEARMRINFLFLSA